MHTTTRPDWSGRLARLQTSLADQDLDALVISQPRNLTYLTGFSGSAGLLVVTPADRFLILDGRYALGAREEQSAGRTAAIPVRQVDKRYDLSLAETITALGSSRVGFEAGHVTVATLQTWQRALPGVGWQATDNSVERLRMVKDAWEQSLFRQAGKMLAGVAGRLTELVARDRTESEIAAGIDAALQQTGFSGPAFPTIVASGPNSARPHARPGDRRLQPGDLVVLDFGGVLDGYCVDLTRVAAVEPVSEAALALFDAVQSANRAALDAVRPGIDVSVIDRAARGVLEARGLGEAFLHATGHGLGLDVHEAPRIGRAELEAPVTVEAGMVFTVEPGAYVREIGGARLEDDVLVTAAGCEVLTEAPRELVVV